MGILMSMAPAEYAPMESFLKSRQKADYEAQRNDGIEWVLQLNSLKY